MNITKREKNSLVLYLKNTFTDRCREGHTVWVTRGLKKNSSKKKEPRNKKKRHFICIHLCVWVWEREKQKVYSLKQKELIQSSQAGDFFFFNWTPAKNINVQVE